MRGGIQLLIRIPNLLYSLMVGSINSILTHDKGSNSGKYTYSIKNGLKKYTYSIKIHQN